MAPEPEEGRVIDEGRASSPVPEPMEPLGLHEVGRGAVVMEDDGTGVELGREDLSVDADVDLAPPRERRERTHVLVDV
jgi:hypothetical protein